MVNEDRSIVRTLVDNGSFLLVLTGLGLFFAGGFALFLTANGHFLPHDAMHIGFTAGELAEISPELANFMFHDRAAFGGALMAMGSLYLWLAAYPLGNGQVWAWKMFLVSGILGFGSFLAYIGYGYLDTWHGVATLVLLPIFVVGMGASGRRLDFSAPRRAPHPPRFPDWKDMAKHGYLCLWIYATGMILGGGTILVVGMTAVFVPQDLGYIEMCGSEIAGISEQMIPVIAHDRAGFGGAIMTIGVTLCGILYHARPSRSLWQVLLVSGVIGFATAIGIHFVIGYTDLVHLSPAYLGVLIYGTGMLQSRGLMCGKTRP